MVDETGSKPPAADDQDSVEDESEREPGDWQDVKRYLLGLMGLILLAVIIMFVVAMYEYRSYNGSKAEDTKMIPARQDVMRQGTLPPRLRKVRGMRQTPSAAPSASSR